MREGMGSRSGAACALPTAGDDRDGPTLANTEMVHAIRNKGARIEWLEAYDPEHNPIEVDFRTAKEDLRRDREALEFLPRRERLRPVLFRVRPEAARSHFRESGYDV